MKEKKIAWMNEWTNEWMNEFGMGKNYATDLWKLCQFNTIHALNTNDYKNRTKKTKAKTKNQYWFFFVHLFWFDLNYDLNSTDLIHDDHLWWILHVLR